ncbi:hypothetical protein KEM55_003286 [Ascosphaera atra]|nr:hypothetical protein KEM55_003286 [Ascosphaera atra]
MAPQAKKKCSVTTTSVYPDKLCSQCVEAYIYRGVKKYCNWCKKYKKKCVPIPSLLNHLRVGVVRAKREYDAAAESSKKKKASDLVKLCEELLENMDQSEILDDTAAAPAKSNAAADSDSDSGEEEGDGRNATAAAKPAF